MADPVVIAAFISAGPATVAAWAALQVKRNTKTNHGKKIGEHVEDASVAAQEAALETRRVRVELGEYKLEQQDAYAELSAELRSHTRSDSDNFAKIIRRLPSEEV